MQLLHESYKRTIERNYEVDQYLMILFVVWAVIETLASSFNFPIKGYTKFQLKRYETYRSLLNGMGETYNEDGEIVIKKAWTEDFSPMTKIIIMSIGNIIFFVIFRFISNTMGEKYADNLVDGLANKLYGQGDQKDLEHVINEITGNKDAPESGFNIGSILNSVISGGGLSNLGNLVGGMFNNKKASPKIKEEVEVNLNTPKKKGTYDDSMPTDILSPANMGFKETNDKTTPSLHRFRPRN
jgi:hypothetical protein